MNDLKNEDTDELFDAIMNLKNKDECYNFFMDVCTVYEIIDMSKRLKAAVLLDEGMSYKEIMQKVDVSTATLSRISKSLKLGYGGYKKAINAIIKNNQKNNIK